MRNRILNKIWGSCRKIYTFIRSFINLCNHSIRYKFTLTIIAIVLIPMGLFYIYMYSNTYSILKKNADSNLKDSVKIISDDLESQFDLINKTSMLFISNATIKSILTSDPQGDSYLKAQNRIEMNRELENLLYFNYAWDKKLLNSVYIYKAPDTYYTISRNLFAQASMKRTNQISRELYFSDKEKELVPPTLNDQTVYFARNIYDLDTLNALGTLVLGIDVGSLSEIDNSLVKYKDIRITTYDNEGTIFSDTDMKNLDQKVDKAFIGLNNSSDIKEVILNGRPYLAAVKKIEGYNLNSVVAVPKDEVFADLKHTMGKYLLTILLSIVFSLATGLYISSKVIKPIKTMTDTTEKLKDGKFNEKLPASRYIELNQLNTIFNKAVDEIDYLIHEVYEKQLLLKESELAVLQSQVNPHFFFNVLETISWEAQFSNNKKIYEMISSLSFLMRGCIALNKNDKVTMDEELKIIESYLKLEKMRFEDRLSYEIHFDSETAGNCYLPKLCLLPIVENSVIHGLETKRDGGQIIIEVTRHDGKIFIRVIDDGKGFDPDKLNIDNMSSELGNKTHVGLYNTNRRIKLMYGMEYGLSIKSCVGCGTEVTICIPYNEGGDINVPRNDC